MCNKPAIKNVIIKKNFFNLYSDKIAMYNLSSVKIGRTNMEKKYHHGNLKNDLIEKGLELIDKYGVESLSMRKLAEKIGVSNAAPYAHFENKEAFLDSIQEYITNKLTNVLKDICDHCNDNSRIILELGKGYICFFL